ncbi:hypothetical protein JKA74_10980 [Marivirga sp. S37H4]|uniref:Type 1 periplasmic binding fold superfamily protein n=1 Tax=Marivirga aurantiaca TaxID=2802615 RepID=A0A934WZ51_9BACT|nr:hypothetical protein [Marivirga aurantiaca]MBK6265562.1 hypothetical protein [Marivirga aurantiaca]
MRIPKMKVSMNNLMRSMLMLAAVFFFSQCDTEDPEPENEEELITTVTLTFSPAGDGEDVLFRVYDEDGDGPIEPVYTNGILEANTTYTVAVEVLNEEEGEDITEEILEEDEEHQFFFRTSNGLNLEFAYNDTDGDGNPIGLSTVFVTGEASEGTLTVTLRHEPNKEAEGVKSGDIANAGGETDVEAVFDVVIQ